MRRLRLAALAVAVGAAVALVPGAPAGTGTPAAVIAPRVTIGGVPVGSLSADEAYAKVRASFERPLTILLGDLQIVRAPAELGAVAYVRGAVATALAAGPGAAVPLQIAVQGAPIRALVGELAVRIRSDPVDAGLFLRDLEPFVTSGRPGRRLDEPGALRAIVQALRSGDRVPFVLPERRIPQSVTRANFGPVVVVRRRSGTLTLYEGMRPVRTVQVAAATTGPAPLGRFSIAVKWRNPWWYPPPAGRAKGQKPIPPGPGNPLGDHWLGLNAPGVGIHVAPDDASVAYSVAHGDVRLQAADGEWLFTHVEVGTTVYIVAA